MSRKIRCLTTGIVAALAVVAWGAPARAGEDADEEKYRKLTTLESTVELGFFYNSREDFAWGDYTGLDQEGFEVLGNSDIRGRSVWDADGIPWYYRVRGLNLGLDSRYLDATFQVPGLVGLEFVLDEIPKLRTDKAATPFRDLDSTLLRLPPDWDPGNNPTPAQMTTLQASLRDLDIEHRRRTLGGGLSVVLTDALEFDASYQRQTKRGNRLSAGMFGRNGGDPRSIIIPELIDYEFHTIESNLRYAMEGFQAQIQYYGSGFNNEHDQTRWQNPFLPAGSYDPAAGYPAFGRKGQMPDNWFHQGIFSAGIDLPARTRVMLNAAFGWGRQDESFLPYTLNPGFDNFANFPLPRDSLDGKVRTGMASFRVVSNPIKNFGINLGYRWNQRDNDSPVDTYFRVLGDSGEDGAGDPDQDPANRRINRPYSYSKHKVDLDLSYKLPMRTKLTLLYDFEHIDRNLQEVDQTDEHTFGGKLITRPHPRVLIGLRGERSYRDEDEYNCVEPLLETEPPALLTDPGCDPGQEFENHPFQRKYNLTDRRRIDGHLWASFAVLDTLTLGVKAKYTLDDYFDSELGLVERRSVTTGFDASWTPVERATLFVFYDYEEGRHKMDSLRWGGGRDPFDVDNGWSVRDTDTFHTAGAGFEFVAIPERLTFGADYLFAHSREVLDTRVNPGTPLGEPFPDAKTELHDVSLRSELRLTDNVSVRLGYLWERFKSRDWAFDQVCVACLDFSGNASVITTGEQPPDYSAHLGSVSVILNW